MKRKKFYLRNNYEAQSNPKNYQPMPRLAKKIRNRNSKSIVTRRKGKRTLKQNSYHLPHRSLTRKYDGLSTYDKYSLSINKDLQKTLKGSTDLFSTLRSLGTQMKHDSAINLNKSKNKQSTDYISKESMTKRSKSDDNLLVREHKGSAINISIPGLDDMEDGGKSSNPTGTSFSDPRQFGYDDLDDFNDFDEDLD